MQNEPYVIGICGGSGSGKSTLMRQIKENFKPDQLTCLAQDHYYIKREEQCEDENGVRNFDMLSSINHEKYVEDLHRLIQGHQIELKEYVYNNDLRQAEILKIRPAPIILLEGLFLFAVKDIIDKIDLKIFVESSDHKMLIRRIKRDVDERNYPTDDVLYRWENHVWPSYLKNIWSHRLKSDIIVNNDVSMDVSVEMLQLFIKQKLIQLKK